MDSVLTVFLFFIFFFTFVSLHYNLQKYDLLYINKTCTLYTSATVSKSIGQVLQCSRHIHKWQCTLIHSTYNVHAPYNNIYIWPHNTLTTGDYPRLIIEACAHTHCSSEWCDFVLKNKEQSIILHLKNLQSFTVGKLIDMVEIILFWMYVESRRDSQWISSYATYETLYNATYTNVTWSIKVHWGQLTQDRIGWAPNIGRVTQVPALHRTSLQVRFIQHCAPTRFFLLFKKEQ